MRILLAILCCSLPVAADTPEGDWDVKCDEATCIVKRAALMEFVKARIPPCFMRGT